YGTSNYHAAIHPNTGYTSGSTVRALKVNPSYATKPLSGKPTGFTDVKYRNYNVNHGIKGSFGWYYKGKNHYHWSHSCYHPSYGCRCYWCPCACCYYYWCVPDSCYYPVTYCPYGCYSWAE
ncbi:MAG TPA: hypothetical protein VFA26_23985, partial [Gemmataceae bacterium]|nr:hypothetical protein [Gemmataceae bacterium]